MGQFAAVIVPQYCGAPAEKPGVLEWAIALKALEMAELSHPFSGHPTMGWTGSFPQLGGVPSAPKLAFWELGSSWSASAWGQLPVPKTAQIAAGKNSHKEKGDTRSGARGSSRHCPTCSLSWPPQCCAGLFWTVFCSPSDQRLISRYKIFSEALYSTGLAKQLKGWSSS